MWLFQTSFQQPPAKRPDEQAGIHKGNYFAASENNINAQDYFLKFLQADWDDVSGLHGKKAGNVQALFYNWMTSHGISEGDAGNYLREISQPQDEARVPGIQQFFPGQIKDGKVEPLLNRLMTGYRLYLQAGGKLKSLDYGMDNAITNWGNAMGLDNTPADPSAARAAKQAILSHVASEPDVASMLLVAARLMPNLDIETRRRVFSSDLLPSQASDYTDMLSYMLWMGQQIANARPVVLPTPIAKTQSLEKLVVTPDGVSPIIPIEHYVEKKRGFLLHFNPDLEQERFENAGSGNGDGLINLGLLNAAKDLTFPSIMSADLAGFDIMDKLPAYNPNAKNKKGKTDFKDDKQFKAVVSKHAGNHPDAREDIEQWCSNVLINSSFVELIYDDCGGKIESGRVDKGNVVDLKRLLLAVYQTEKKAKELRIGGQEPTDADWEQWADEVAKDPNLRLKMSGDQLKMKCQYLDDPSNPASPAVYARAEATQELLAKTSVISLDEYAQMADEMSGNVEIKDSRHSFFMDPIKEVYGITRTGYENGHETVPDELKPAIESGHVFKKVDLFLVYNLKPGETGDSRFKSINEAVQEMETLVGYGGEKDVSSAGYNEMFVRPREMHDSGRSPEGEKPLLPTYDPATKTWSDNAILTGIWAVEENKKMFDCSPTADAFIQKLEEQNPTASGLALSPLQNKNIDDLVRAGEGSQKLTLNGKEYQIEMKNNQFTVSQGVWVEVNPDDPQYAGQAEKFYYAKTAEQENEWDYAVIGRRWQNGKHLDYEIDDDSFTKLFSAHRKKEITSFDDNRLIIQVGTPVDATGAAKTEFEESDVIHVPVTMTRQVTPKQ